MPSFLGSYPAATGLDTKLRHIRYVTHERGVYALGAGPRAGW